MTKQQVLEDYLEDLADNILNSKITDVVSVEEFVDYTEDHKPVEYRITFSWPINEDDSQKVVRYETYDDFGAPIDRP